MKHLIRDIIIFCIDVLGISFLYRLYCRRRGPLVRVLCFHDVADAAWFESVIVMLTKKYHVITPEQFHEGNFDAEKINVLLTFDDGYQSWIDNCLPVLRHYGLKGLFFVNSGLLDMSGDEEKTVMFMRKNLQITPKEPLTWSGAKLLAKEGHTIGGHTTTHADLGKVKEEVIWEEIVSDKHRLEKELGTTLSDFAFPFGTRKHISEKAVNVGTQRGYKYQYLAITGFCQGTEKLIPRTLIEKNQSHISVTKWVLGGYDIFRALI
jgi:peptidoglycan/xylan/chitin deacetylase (PgdA/CDA1 family)